MAKPTPKRTPPRLLTVVKTERLSAVMQRLTFGGESLKGFPTDQNGAHIKLFFRKKHQEKLVLPTLSANGVVWPEAHQRPIARTYSVRRYCPDSQTLQVDFVLHGHDSPASGWAAKAKPGDTIGLAGPGGPDPLLAPAEQHLLTGDLSALPAICALTEQLPESAQGHVLIDIENDNHRLPIHAPKGISVHWVLRTHPNALLDAVKALFLGKNLSAFIAGENASVVAIRDHLRSKYGLKKRELYAIPYWHRGQDEETYHQERHRIMDQAY